MQKQGPQAVRFLGGRSNAFLHHHPLLSSTRPANGALAARLAQFVEHRLTVAGVVPHAYPLYIGPQWVPFDTQVVTAYRLDVTANTTVPPRHALFGSHA